MEKIKYKNYNRDQLIKRITELEKKAKDSTKKKA